MTPKLIETLLSIAEKANRFGLNHLRDAALSELKTATLNTVETIIPIMIVNSDEKAEAEPPRNDRATSAVRRTS
jgi:hypothetical protein